MIDLNLNSTFTHIFHLSDIHIRVGDDSIQSRFHQYSTVFANLRKYLQNHDAVLNQSALAVVTGDIFHSKTKLDSFAVSLFNSFTSSISSLLPLLIIIGNHDIRVDRPDTPDFISALLSSGTYDNVYFLNKSTHYIAGNIGFGLVRVEDVLLHGTSSGKLIDELPPFPDPKLFPPSIDKTAALFHGTIRSCTLQNYSSDLNGIPIDWFRGYNYALLGDIHLQQIHERKELIWAYPGSLLQQNFGEEILNHGLLEWDLQANNVNPIHIKSPTGFLKLQYINDDWYVLNAKKPLSDILAEPRCPSYFDIRIFNNPSSDQTENLTALLIRNKKHFVIDNIQNSTQENGIICIEKDSIISFNSIDNWMKFICEHSEDRDMHQDWKSWFKEPRTLSMPTYPYNDKYISEKIDQKNIILDKSINKTFDNADQYPMTAAKLFRLKYMEWAWILCFENDCHLNFDSMSGFSTMIEGLNGIGKTSFFETVLLSIFGECSPEKTNHSFSASIINRCIPSGQKPKTYIKFTLNDVDIHIQRTFRTSSTDPKKLKESEVKLFSEDLSCVLSGNRTVSDWLNKNLCNIDEFLQYILISQSGKNDFFDSKSQIEMIEAGQNIDALFQFNNVLDTSIKNHSYVLNMIDDINNNELSMIESFNPKLIDDLKDEQNRLEELLSKKQSQKIDITFAAKDDSDYDANITQIISELQSERNKITILLSRDEALIEQGKLKYIQEKHCKFEHIDIHGDVQTSIDFVNEFDDQNRLIESLQIKNKALNNEIQCVNSKLRTVTDKKLGLQTDLNTPSTPKDVSLSCIQRYEKLSKQKSTIEKNIKLLRKKQDKYLRSCKDLDDSQMKKDNIIDQINSIKSFNHPYNPDCFACQSQHWKINLNKLELELLNVEALIVKNKNIVDLNTVNSSNLDKYNDQLQFIDDVSTNAFHRDNVVKWEMFENKSNQIEALKKEECLFLQLYKDLNEAIQSNDNELNTIHQYVSNNQDAYKEHLYFIENSDYIRKYGHLDDTLKIIDLKESLNKQILYWESIKETKKSFLLNKNLDIQISELNREYSEIQSKILSLNEKLTIYNRCRDRSNYLSDIKQRLSSMSTIFTSFKEYRKTIFENHLLPYIVDQTNRIVSNISSNSLKVCCEFEVSEHKMLKSKVKESLNWYFEYENGTRLPIEKTSGFQRNLIAFSVRIVLNRINNKIFTKHLLIDEGFTSFDRIHLANVADLFEVLKGEFELILFSSHLESLKECAEKNVLINRCNGLSSIKFGSKLNLPNEFFAVKKGRKKKNLFE